VLEVAETEGVAMEEELGTAEYQSRAAREEAEKGALRLTEGDAEEEEYQLPKPRATSEVAEAEGVATDEEMGAAEYQPRAASEVPEAEALRLEDGETVAEECQSRTAREVAEADALGEEEAAPKADG
jgi:hypothetical protein